MTTPSLTESMTARTSGEKVAGLPAGLTGLSIIGRFSSYKSCSSKVLASRSHETLELQDLYEENRPMIDKPVSPAGNPATFSPLVRAVIDSVNEGVVIFDQQGRLLYANASARRVIDGGGNGDVRNRLQ